MPPTSPPKRKSQTVMLPLMTREAVILPESIDVEARTVEVVASSGARMLKYSWAEGGDFEEELEISQSAIRLGRLQSGRAPVLDSHMQHTLERLMGVVVGGDSVRIKDGLLHAKLRLSGRNEAMEEHWRGIREGVITSVSMLYRVHTYRDVTQKGAIRTVKRAIDWEPFSVDFVSIPADPEAGARSQGTNLSECTLLDADAPLPSRANMDPEELNNETTEEGGAESRAQDTTSETPPTATKTPAPAPASTPAPSARSAAPSQPTPADVVAAERQRCAEIRQAVSAIGESRAFADELENSGISADEARRRCLERAAARSEESDVSTGHRGGGIEVGTDEIAQMRSEATLALEARIGLATDKDLEGHDLARRMRGMSLLRLGEELLSRRGVKNLPGDKMELAGMALGFQSRGGMHGTADFPLILADVANRRLRRAYEAQPQTWRTIARRGDAPDFKTINRPNLGEITSLDEVQDTGEIKYKTVGETNESYALATYANRFAISRKAVVNDDQSAFDRIPRILGRAATETESNLAWGLITGPAPASDGVTMGDGKALFHADHANTSSGVISVANLGLAREKLRLQTGINGLKLNIMPAYLIVPAKLETIAQQFTAQIQPDSGGSVNPFSSVFRQIIVEARLDADSALEWYIAADPDQIEILEYAYLAGSGEGPMLDSKQGWEVDGVEFRIRHDFAVSALDYRGLVRSSGA